jgi:SAM-dependent methyltransferase
MSVPDEGVAAPHRREPGSFRDRTAQVFYIGDEVYRGLTGPAFEAWQRTAASMFFQRAMREGTVIATRLDAAPPSPRHGQAAERWTAVLHHERIPFITYPYEWSFSMLKDAARLHLELLRDALKEDVTMKDGTPFNIQWNGVTPVFIDVTTFVPWRHSEPWAGYRQFCQMCLFPLMLQANKGVPFQPWLRGRLEGIRADECRRLLSWRDWLRPGVLTHVVAQSSLERQMGRSTRSVRNELHRSGLERQVIMTMVRRLGTLVDSLSWSPAASNWSEYATCNSYDEDGMRAKQAFVDAAVREKPRDLVWDLGCNTGTFSKIAARHAGYVVAVDADQESIERLYRELRRTSQPNILPLTIDLSDPSPATGWRTQERQTLLQRGRPDLVLCLALIHHLAITANVPVSDVIAWLFECGGDLVIEFPTEDDEMVRRLLVNKDQAYEDYCLPAFEASLHEYFDVRQRVMLPSGTRYLYYGTRRARVGGTNVFDQGASR